MEQSIKEKKRKCLKFERSDYLCPTENAVMVHFIISANCHQFVQENAQSIFHQKCSLFFFLKNWEYQDFMSILPSFFLHALICILPSAEETETELWFAEQNFKLNKCNKKGNGR